jgi:hypothetical protein
VNENKEECTALGKHAEELTSKLLIHLKLRNDLDAMRPSIDSFVKCVIDSLKRLRSCLHRRTLEGINAFTENQAEMSLPKQLLRRHRSLNEIKEWDILLKRAYDFFHVTTSSTLLGVYLKLTEFLIDRCWPLHSS